MEITTLIPETNLELYSLIYKIEVGLRELLIQKLGEKDSRWWKQRLPGDVLDKYKSGRIDERKVTWIGLIPHHPLYYIDFPDLRKVIERNDNWKDVFQVIFSDKDVVCGLLREIEPIRNKIAHNRKVSKHDVTQAEAAYIMISDAVGNELFESLIMRCTVAQDLYSTIEELCHETSRLYSLCNSIQPIDDLTLWERVKSSWWYDDDYLGHSVQEITQFFTLLIAYTQLPRYRGAGYEIEEWIKTNALEASYHRALLEFEGILARP